MRPKQKRIPIAALIAAGVIITLLQVFFSEIITSNFVRHMQIQRHSSVTKMVDLAHKTISPVIRQVSEGTTTREAALDEIRVLVRRMTYYDEFGPNYIFMSSYDGTMLVQPFEPAKEGTNQWDLKDAHGKFIIRELVAAAKARSEGSYVTYSYYPPGKTEPEEKLSYVIGIPEIGAYIGTGMYMEGSYKALQFILFVQRLGYAILVLIILVFMIVYIRELYRRNSMLATEIANRELAEEQIREQYQELLKTQKELLEKHDELVETYEELASTEEELRRNYYELDVAHEEKRQQAEKIRQMAYYDDLTGMPNKLFLMEKVKEALAENGEKRKLCALLIIDMDNFKAVNDTYGHPFGDTLVRHMADRLAATVGKYAETTLARLGGDEFVLFMDALVDVQTAERAALDILKAFRAPTCVHDQCFHMTSSIGISVFPQNGLGADELLKNAETAMYKAKELGRDRYVLFDGAMGEELSFRMEMENSLRHAVTDDEFRLYYQPQVSIDDGRIIGFEALIRWFSPKYGMVSPARFIPLAEETGIITQIGKWVIENACLFASRLYAAGAKDLYVSVNVSPLQFKQLGFMDMMMAMPEKFGIPPSSIAIEITETTLMESFDTVIEKLKRLGEHGFAIYLDDFGTGYSSLNYLKNLPIHAVKIDKSFISGIHNEGVEKMLVQSIIQMAHNIGLQVVAEGVETQEQLEYLAQCSCNHFQGYLASRPVPEEEAERMVVV